MRTPLTPLIGQTQSHFKGSADLAHVGLGHAAKAFDEDRIDMLSIESRYKAEKRHRVVSGVEAKLAWQGFGWWSCMRR